MSEIPVIELWGIDSLFGVILECKSGVFYSNQVGGTSCQHPTVEGVYIPLHGYELGTDPLYDDYDASVKAVKEFVNANHGINEFFEYIEDERAIHEAWVPLRIRKDLSLDPIVNPLFHSLLGKKVILVYSNSD